MERIFPFLFFWLYDCSFFSRIRRPLLQLCAYALQKLWITVMGAGLDDHLEKGMTLMVIETYGNYLCDMIQDNLV